MRNGGVGSLGRRERGGKQCANRAGPGPEAIWKDEEHNMAK